MSEKEKRILVLEVNPDCKALKFDGDPFDEEDVVYCDKNGRWERIKTKDCKKCKSPVLAGITRAEAVEIMAKEIFKAEICEGSGFNVKPSDFDPKDWHKKWVNLRTDKKRIYYAVAEAALDALLGKEAENGK